MICFLKKFCNLHYKKIRVDFKIEINPDFFNFTIVCVIHHMGQNTHHVLGLNSNITMIPINVEVSIKL